MKLFGPFHKILMQMFSDLHEILYATCRDYRLDLCTLASHRTMSCRMMKLRPASGSVHPPPASRKLRGVSCALHPHHKIADSLRLWALSVLSSHQNWGTSQAACTPIVKSLTVSGSGHFLCSPRTKSVGRLRPFAPPC